MTGGVRIARLDAAAAHLDALADVLADCVAGGASVNFMWPHDAAEARRWWQAQLPRIDAGDPRLFGAFLDGRLVGCVMLALDGPCNQRHRGDVRKLLVHRDARGRGVARALMAALEHDARALGLELLTLDTAVGGDADRLYAALGWTRAGEIPNFARWPDGRPCATAIYYRALC